MVSAMVWKCVAAAQTAFWFFALPPLCKPYWARVWALSPWPLASQIFLNQIALVYLVFYALVMLPIYRGNYTFFEQYKISNQPWAWRSEKQEDRDAFLALSLRSVKLICFNFGVLLPILTVGKFFVLGDSTSFEDADWPSYGTLFRDNVAMTLVHEFGFYWSHRLAHHPTLYKFHKVHHEYHQNTVLAAQHVHPIDFVVSFANPALLAVIIVGPHSFTHFQWIAWLAIANIDDHAGYEFPWSPVRWFPFAAATGMHEFHHSKNMGCFASKLNIYDKIFKSEQPYLKWRAARDAKAEMKAE
jgi:sterol desaturase/sphingolipid hydroxylase (fatty acid hydroxylase superfamily)